MKVKVLGCDEIINPKERTQQERVKNHNKSCDCGCQNSDKVVRNEFFNHFWGKRRENHFNFLV